MNSSRLIESGRCRETASMYAIRADSRYRKYATLFTCWKASLQAQPTPSRPSEFTTRPTIIPTALAPRRSTHCVRCCTHMSPHCHTQTQPHESTQSAQSAAKCSASIANSKRQSTEAHMRALRSPLCLESAATTHPHLDRREHGVSLPKLLVRRRGFRQDNRDGLRLLREQAAAAAAQRQASEARGHFAAIGE